MGIGKATIRVLAGEVTKVRKHKNVAFVDVIDSLYSKIVQIRVDRPDSFTLRPGCWIEATINQSEENSLCRIIWSKETTKVKKFSNIRPERVLWETLMTILQSLQREPHF
mgnify:CR=1 FL=1